MRPGRSAGRILCGLGEEGSKLALDGAIGIDACNCWKRQESCLDDWVLRCHPQRNGAASWRRDPKFRQIGEWVRRETASIFLDEQ